MTFWQIIIKQLVKPDKNIMITKTKHVAGVPLDWWTEGETPCAWVTGETPDVDILTVGGMPRVSIRKVADGWAVNTAGRAGVRWVAGRGMVVHVGTGIYAGAFETYFRAKVAAEKVTDLQVQ